MAIRKIAQIGHPVLRQIARDVSREELATPAMQGFIDDLVATMHDADGAGLAAIQVYEPIRICAIEVRNNPRYPYKPPIPLTILVNPVLTPVGDEVFENNEGCLSVPNLRGMVQRHVHVH
ncbi:MAG: peptide deformylase, partial [Polyangiales bacterium]